MRGAEPLSLSLPAHTGLSGSMNFDEASENEADAEDGLRSLSPNTDATRPASAASGKDVPVSFSASCWNKKFQSQKLTGCFCCPSGACEPRNALCWRRHPRGRGQPGGVRGAASSPWHHRQVPHHQRQEGHGPRPLPHLLHAHGEGGWQAGRRAGSGRPASLKHTKDGYCFLCRLDLSLGSC